MSQTEKRFNDMYSDGDIRVLDIDGQVTLWEIGLPETWLDAPGELVIEDLTEWA